MYLLILNFCNPNLSFIDNSVIYTLFYFVENYGRCIAAIEYAILAVVYNEARGVRLSLSCVDYEE